MKEDLEQKLVNLKMDSVTLPNLRAEHSKLKASWNVDSWIFLVVYFNAVLIRKI